MEHIADTMTLNILCGVIVFMITRYLQSWLYKRGDPGSRGTLTGVISVRALTSGSRLRNQSCRGKEVLAALPCLFLTIKKR